MFATGEVVRFNYGQDNTQHTVKVKSVRDTWEKPVSTKTLRANPNIARNRFLVTGQETDGQIKSFYTDSMGLNVKRYGLIGRAVLYLMGVRFG